MVGRARATNAAATSREGARAALYTAMAPIARSASVSSPNSLWPRLASSRLLSASSARRNSAVSVPRASLIRRSAAHGLMRIYPAETVNVPALRGLDLSVASGEVVGIVGPSGSG